ncbi:MAG: hypothetical protein DRQ24_10545 [Candidatus Latescibacterota bacterium]|nr:MAG: hypothetical protein DRQ24_10545 [Candidatus Latescibacterota bacterium]
MTTVNCGLWTKRGFTLLELLVVLVILSFFLAVMPEVFRGYLDQRKFEKTRKGMQEIKKALFGSTPYYSISKRKVAGYIVDMGGLPPLDASTGQPKALWTNDLNGDGEPDLPDWRPLSSEIDPYCTWYGKGRTIFIGWRGPYIEEPTDGVLRDGWGNPLVFSVVNGDMTIRSYGADGIEGGLGYDKDIALTIRQREYMAAIAGQVDFENTFADNIRVRIYYPLNGVETKKTIVGVNADGYFRFESVSGESDGRGRANVNIPIGMRPVIAWIEDEPADDPEKDNPSFEEKQEMILFYARPTGNWVGVLNLK